MSTLAIPQAFTGDTQLSSTKLMANFDAIRAFLNGTAGGVDGDNLNATAKLQGSQVAERWSLSHLMVAAHNLTMGSESGWHYLWVPETCRLVAMRVNMHHEYSAPNYIKMTCKLGFSLSGPATWVEFDENVTYQVGGDHWFRMDLRLPKDMLIWVSFTPEVSSGSGSDPVVLATAQLTVATEHVGL